MEGENEQLEQTQQPVGGDDTPPTPVEVTLPEDGAEAVIETPAGEQEQQPEPAPKAPKTERLPAGVKGYDADGNPIYEKRAKQRIHELVAAGRVSVARAEEAERRLAQVEREKADLAARSAVVDKAAMDTHEQHWAAKAALAKREYADAVRAGDADLQAEANVRVSEAASELQAIRAYKANQPAPEQPRQEQRQPQPGNGHVQPQPQIQITEPMRAWIEENPYLVSGTDDFDPEMSAHAQHAATLLDGRYRRSGRQGEIGASDEYFTELTGMIQQEFPEYWEGQPAPQPSPRPQQRRAIPMTRQNGAGVAPASRATTPAPGQNGARTVSLSGDEKDMALRMAHNGAYKYPAGHKQAGQRMTDQDAIVHHARYVQADRLEQAKK